MRQGCAPGLDWLHPIDEYAAFFAGLKPRGRVALVAIAGPTQPVEVVLAEAGPALKPSCQSSSGSGTPAIRLEALARAFDSSGHFNAGAGGAKVNICSPDLAPALALLGDRVICDHWPVCLPPPVTSGCGVACTAGDLIGTDAGTPVLCQSSCLDRADCVVEEVIEHGSSEEKWTVMPRCEADAFAIPHATCGGTCPCWRLVSSTSCKGQSSPYELSILRTGRAPRGSVAVVHCQASAHPWGSVELARTGQCL